MRSGTGRWGCAQCRATQARFRATIPNCEKSGIRLLNPTHRLLVSNRIYYPSIRHNHSFTHSLGGGQGGGPRARAPPPRSSPDPSSCPSHLGQHACARASPVPLGPLFLSLFWAASVRARAREPPLRPSSEHHQHHCACGGTNLRPSGTLPDLLKHRPAEPGKL